MGKLRVHGGELAGRRLKAPHGIRPTQGVIKEAIFNVLAAEVPGATVLDLFAGSGALGIESLSRGAARATFVESSGSSITILRQNLEALGCADRARVVHTDAVRWLESHSAEVGAASLVLLDPPYGEPQLERALQLLDAHARGTVVVEHAAGDPLPALKSLRVARERSYGDTRLTILRPGALDQS